MTMKNVMNSGPKYDFNTNQWSLFISEQKTNALIAIMHIKQYNVQNQMSIGKSNYFFCPSTLKKCKLAT
jgi:hypothetical protein